MIAVLSSNCDSQIFECFYIFEASEFTFDFVVHCYDPFCYILLWQYMTTYYLKCRISIKYELMWISADYIAVITLCIYFCQWTSFKWLSRLLNSSVCMIISTTNEHFLHKWKFQPFLFSEKYILCCHQYFQQFTT